MVSQKLGFKNVDVHGLVTRPKKWKRKNRAIICPSDQSHSAKKAKLKDVPCPATWFLCVAICIYKSIFPNRIECFLLKGTWLTLSLTEMHIPLPQSHVSVSLFTLHKASISGFSVCAADASTRGFPTHAFHSCKMLQTMNNNLFHQSAVHGQYSCFLCSFYYRNKHLSGVSD